MVLKFRQDENLNLVPTCKELGNCCFTHTRKKNTEHSENQQLFWGLPEK